MYGSELKLRLSRRLLVGDWMLLTWDHSVKSPGSRTLDITNATARETITGCPSVSSLIQGRRLRFFVLQARGIWADSKQDQHRLISTSLRPPRHVTYHAEEDRCWWSNIGSTQLQHGGWQRPYAQATYDRYSNTSVGARQLKKNKRISEEKKIKCITRIEHDLQYG